MKNKKFNLSFEIKKEYIFVVLILSSVFALSLIITAVPSGSWGHDASEINVYIPNTYNLGKFINLGYNNKEMTLQEAIDNGPINPKTRSLPKLSFYNIASSNGDIYRQGIGKHDNCFVTVINSGVNEGGSSNTYGYAGIYTGGIFVAPTLILGSVVSFFGSEPSIRAACATDIVSQSSCNDPNFNRPNLVKDCVPNEYLISAKRSYCEFACIDWNEH